MNINFRSVWRAAPSGTPLEAAQISQKRAKRGAFFQAGADRLVLPDKDHVHR
jgi:hypothetical protein